MGEWEGWVSMKGWVSGRMEGWVKGRIMKGWVSGRMDGWVMVLVVPYLLRRTST